ncbi:microtubule-destabilizing protein 60-like isoform X1 [Syzygium oleosum]|uniref:microtubule-destabilizing protein 60-like isoform X1 n=2 Tax=Syzygium oleosum TaxID=219896 RepID=UPI0024BBA2D8|nr:microtubule-destabilizing protein 60-like isoform X1 [Syzygium oleosum]
MTMDSVHKSCSSATTPAKESRGAASSRSKHQSQEATKLSENVNPNLSHASPGPRAAAAAASSPAAAAKSGKSQKSASKNPNPASNCCSPNRNRIRDRKFVRARRNARRGEAVGPRGAAAACKCKEKAGKKCLCVAYESLRASQEEFFKSKGREGGELIELGEEMENRLMIHDLGNEEEGFQGKTEGNGSSPLEDLEFCELGEIGAASVQVGVSTVKRRRDKLMEEARKSVPESGCGRVMHLVKAFENLLKIPNPKEADLKDEIEVAEEQSRKKVMSWALPGLPPPKAPETEVSSSSFSPSELHLTAENLGLDSQASLSSSWDSSQGSVSSRTSNGGRRSRRNSLESYGTLGGSRWKKKQLRVTSQKPFQLRTEQRGRMKEEEFMKKMRETMVEEERLRIPVAQGLPWTTDEPEYLIKPPVKENTRPLDLKLHSDMRAAERAEFDHQIAEKMSLIEQYKMERERQQKLAEEEEIRRLRRELVPKAQPMPYFDRPFIPKRSLKNPTIPREPKFHIPQQKKIKCCLSWNDMSPYTYHECAHEDMQK